MAHVGQTPPKFITEKSKAFITTPVNRTMPITFYAEKYGAVNNAGGTPSATLKSGLMVSRTPSTPLSTSTPSSTQQQQKITPTNSPTQQRKFPTRRGSESKTVTMLHRQNSAPSPTRQQSPTLQQQQQQQILPVTRLTPASPKEFQNQRHRNAQASDSGIFVDVVQQQQQPQQQQEVFHQRLQPLQSLQRPKLPRRTGSEDGLLTVATPDVVNGNFNAASSSYSSPSSPAGGQHHPQHSLQQHQLSAYSSPSSPASMSPR